MEHIVERRRVTDPREGVPRGPSRHWGVRVVPHCEQALGPLAPPPTTGGFIPSPPENKNESGKAYVSKSKNGCAQPFPALQEVSQWQPTAEIWARLRCYFCIENSHATAVRSASRKSIYYRGQGPDRKSGRLDSSRATTGPSPSTTQHGVNAAKGSHRNRLQYPDGGNRQPP
jgi:hypothetical protein